MISCLTSLTQLLAKLNWITFLPTFETSFLLNSPIFKYFLNDGGYNIGIDSTFASYQFPNLVESFL